MLIYFSASARNFEADLPLYKVITTKIYSLGHTLTHDWIESARLRIERGGAALENIESIVRDAENGIESADVLIAEASDRSAFGVGYEVAIAINKRKPVLLLLKRDTVKSSYASGLQNSYITIKKYDAQSIERHIEDFIKANVVRNKDLRFNFVIDRHIYHFLRRKAHNTQKTKAEIVRELLQEEMRKND